VTILAAVGLVVVVATAVVVSLELLARAVALVERALFVKPVRRKDFLAPGYQPYVNWVEDWSKPMFRYVPIGLRLYNIDNPIPGRVENNSLGFRCGEFTDPEPDVLRVVLLGGSAAWGSGAASNAHTIAGQLERLINDDRRLLGSKRAARCFNLAQVNGYQTQDVLTLLFFTPRLAPHVVVSFTGWNELMANDTMRRAHLERYGVFYMNEMEGWEPAGGGGHRKRAMKDALRGWGRERFELARRWDARRRAEPAEAEPVEARIALGTRLFIEHLRIIERLASAYEFTHVQVLQPYVYRKKALTEQEQRVIRLYDEVRPVHGGRATGDFLRSTNIYRSLLDEVEREGLLKGRLVDLCDVFREDRESMFYTLVHLTDRGYQRVAEEMYAALLRTQVQG